MAVATVPLGNRVDTNLKSQFDETAEQLGLSPTAALTVFMKRFVTEGGFPFEVKVKTPSEAEYAAEMDVRYHAMLTGNETKHELIEA